MLNIDRMSRTPIYSQIIKQIEFAILSGELPPGSQIPSVRTLSVQLSVNPNTLQKAYIELERMGLCYSVSGSGRFVSEDAYKHLLAIKNNMLSEVESISRELRLAGVGEHEVLDAVSRIYNQQTEDGKTVNKKMGGHST